MSEGRRVLVCDDERQILRALRVILSDAGFEVATAATAQEALDSVSVRPPDAAILDLLLPDGNGVDICRSIREWSEMPIVVLSAVGEEYEKVRALEAGADDYVTKPFGSGELVARLRAALRRAAGSARDEPMLRADGLELDQVAHRVTVAGNDVHLTPIEFRLLQSLMQNRGRLMTHRALLADVWGAAYEDDTKVLRVHVANLRRKIERQPGSPTRILTDPGCWLPLRRLIIHRPKWTRSRLMRLSAACVPPAFHAGQNRPRRALPAPLESSPHPDRVKFREAT